MPSTTSLKSEDICGTEKCKHQKQAPSLKSKKLNVFFGTEDSKNESNKSANIYFGILYCIVAEKGCKVIRCVGS
jgi:hypothetical protein